jgi:hypothetical protein
VEVAVATGVPVREWLDDPTALVTAAEVLEEIAERTQARR